MAAGSFFSSDTDDRSHRARKQKETLHSFLRDIHWRSLCVLDAFSLTSAFLFRPQLLRCRVAEAMVRSERYDFLLLWDRQRLVLDVSSTYCRSMFVEYIRANSRCLPSSTDKHQKGSLYISDYDVQLVNNLRKDSKKNSCFELFAPGRRSFQVSIWTHLFPHSLFIVEILVYLLP